MPVAAPRLAITDADGDRIVHIDKARFTIGRNADVDLRLEEADISRMHAEIVVANGAYVLRDLKSSWGTFVNGERTTEAPLAHGDELRFGGGREMSIVFHLDAVRREAGTIEKHVASAATELRQVAALLKGLRALGSGRVVDEVLTLVLDSAIDVTGAERGFIMLANREKQLDFKLARARGQVTLPGRTFATSRKIPETVFATGEPAIVEDLASHDIQRHAGTIALGIRYVLCLPLRLVRYVEKAADRGAEESIGVLYLDSREKGDLSSAATLTALDALSAEAALAIENARLYREALDKAKVEQELQVASAIQLALMPPPHYNGAFCRASGASVACRAVGGDFFDYIELPDDRFGFIVGDVSGKGPPAALLSTAALGMFSAEASYQTSTATLMARLNHGLRRRAIDARYLTSFYGIVAANGDFLYSNAGHNPPLLVSPSEVRRLETGGTVLGLFSGTSYDEETVRLERGDVVIAFSDGVTEALNPEGEEFTDERLIDAVKAHRGKPPQEMLAALMADLQAFCRDATQTDDVTLIAMEYTGVK